MEQFSNFILSLGIGINLLVLLILWKNSLQLLHHKLLFVIFSFVVSTLVCLYGFENRNAVVFYTTYLAQDTFILTLGPLVFLYVQSIVLPAEGLLKSNIKHFLFPVVYLLLVSVPIWINLMFGTFSFEYLRLGNENLFSLVIMYSLVYCILTLRLLQKAKAVILQNYADGKGVNLNWLKKFLNGIIVVITIDILTTLYEFFFHDFKEVVYIISTAIVLLMLYLAYHGIFQAKVFLPEFLLQNHGLIRIPEEQEIVSRKIKSTSEFDKEELAKLAEDLEQLMKKERLYLDTAISLKTLSKKLDISDKKLSQLLNQYMHVSFNDYINRLRVEEFKKRIHEIDTEKYTLFAIALDSGFNSKSSFNRIFSKEVGMTPTQFKSKVKSKV